MGVLWGMGICFLLFVVLPRWAEDLSRGTYSPPRSKDRQVFEDPELGEVRYDPDIKTLEVQALHDGRPVALQLIGSGDVPAGLELLRPLHRDFERLERRARAVCVRDLLSEANQDWRPRDAPELDGEAFQTRLTVLWLVADPDGEYRFAYSFDEWGGSLAVVVEATQADGPLSAELYT
jgi:hypothetical protein